MGVKKIDQHIYDESPKVKLQIDAARKSIDLPPLRKGTNKCLKCGNTFQTEDAVGNRICPRCKHLWSE